METVAHERGPEPEAAPGRWREWGLALLLAVGVLLAFGASSQNGFVDYDDPDYVFENEHVTGGLTAQSVRWAFTETYASNWHPLTWISHMLDVELFGLEPAGHHWTSVLLHALNALVLFAALRMMRLGLGQSFLVVAIFAWHPLRVESVTWISERKDLLSSSFFFAAILAHAWNARSPSFGRFLWVVLAMALGLMAKPMLVTLPIVLLLLDQWPLRRSESFSRLVLEKLPLFALSLASVVITLVAQTDAQSSLQALPLTLRVENALATTGVYVMQTIDPRHLAVFYPHAAVTSESPHATLLVPAVFWGIVLVAGCLYAWRKREDHPWWFVGAAWYLVMLLPVIGVIQVGVHAHADRYTYLPMIGLVLACAQGLRDLVAERRTWRTATLGAILVALLACILLTRQQVATWRDTGTLFGHALEVTERNYVAHNNLGVAQLERGDTVAARASFEHAVAIQPSYPEAANNLGLMLFEDGQLEKARILFERALAVTPDDPITRMNLGSVALAEGDLDGAWKHLNGAEEAGYVHADLDFNLGLLAQYNNDRAEARRRYLAAVERNPDHAGAWSNLGELQLFAGDAGEAVVSFQRVVELDPSDPVSHYNLGVAQEESGDSDAARLSFQRALDLAPDLEAARARLEALGS